ncbi:MAG TPA: MGMT family protein [Myxococcales bacterium]
MKRKPPEERSEFELSVAELVRSIPRGKTMSYGDVALWLGKPGGARAVVRALYATEGLPWWRVIRSDSTLAPEVAAEQGRRLRAEGLVVRGRRVVRSQRETALARPRKA